MNGKDMIGRNIIKLAKGLDVFDIPKLVTTQYAKGLGQTIGPVAEALGEFEPLDKSTFSAMGLEEFKEKLESAAKKTVVIDRHRDTYMCGTDCTGSDPGRIQGGTGC